MSGHGHIERWCGDEFSCFAYMDGVCFCSQRLLWESLACVSPSSCSKHIEWPPLALPSLFSGPFSQSTDVLLGTGAGRLPPERPHPSLFLGSGYPGRNSKTSQERTWNFSPHPYANFCERILVNCIRHDQHLWCMFQSKKTQWRTHCQQCSPKLPLV